MPSQGSQLALAASKMSLGKSFSWFCDRISASFNPSSSANAIEESATAYEVVQAPLAAYSHKESQEATALGTVPHAEQLECTIRKLTDNPPPLHVQLADEVQPVSDSLATSAGLKSDGTSPHRPPQLSGPPSPAPSPSSTPGKVLCPLPSLPGNALTVPQTSVIAHELDHKVITVPRPATRTPALLDNQSSCCHAAPSGV
jgi:hypothetical protein